MKGRYKVTFRKNNKVTYEFHTDFKAVAINTALRHSGSWCDTDRVTVTDTKTGKIVIK